MYDIHYTCGAALRIDEVYFGVLATRRALDVTIYLGTW